jgi:uncharacterized membrane protein YraQ (UPF0718 family)
MAKRRNSQMLVPMIVMGILAIVLFYIGYQRGEGEHITGLKNAFDMILQILPLLIFAFIVAGMVQVMIPKEQLAKWIDWLPVVLM